MTGASGKNSRRRVQNMKQKHLPVYAFEFEVSDGIALD